MRFGQTGTAVVFLNEAEFEFTPTTVDSSLTVDFQLVNTIAAASVFFGGLGGPFELVDDSPVELNSQDTLTVSVTFTPSEIGTATDTLEVVGSIFGNAALVLSGEGIQVQLDWSGFDVVFETTAIGATSYADLNVTNVGNGTAVLQFEPSQSDVFSLEFVTDSVDYLDFTPGSLPEGETQILRFSFSPQIVGDTTQVLGLTSNSPLLPLANFTCMGSAVAELEGEVCADLTLANSPFNLVGPVVIPEGCSVNVEAGVQIIQNGHSITVFGDFNCLGTADQPIDLYGGGLDLRAGPITTLNHVNRIAPNQAKRKSWCTSTRGATFRIWFHTVHPMEEVVFQTLQQQLRRFWTSSIQWQFLVPLQGYEEGFFSSIDSIYAPHSGVYEFSFIWQCTTLDRLCSWSFETLQDGEWITSFSNPLNSSTSNRKNFARVNVSFEEGDLILWRFRLTPYSSSSYYDEVAMYVDEFRIGSTQNNLLVSDLDVEMLADSLSLGEENGQGLSVAGDTLRVSALNSSFSLNTADELSYPLFTAPADGFYYLTFKYHVLIGEDYCYPFMNMNDNSGDSHAMFIEYGNPSSDGLGQQDWREITIHYPYPLAQGAKVHLDFGAYIYSTNSEADELIWELFNVRLHRVGPGDGIQRDVSANGLSNSAMVVQDAAIELDSSSVDHIELANGFLHALNSSFHKIQLSSSPAELQECDVIGSDSYGIRSDGTNASLVVFGCEISGHNDSSIHAGAHHLHLVFKNSNNNGYGVYRVREATRPSTTVFSQNASGGFTPLGHSHELFTVVNNGGHGVQDFRGEQLYFGSTTATHSCTQQSVRVSYTNVQGINALLTSPTTHGAMDALGPIQCSPMRMANWIRFHLVWMAPCHGSKTRTSLTAWGAPGQTWVCMEDRPTTIGAVKPPPTAPCKSPTCSTSLRTKEDSWACTSLHLRSISVASGSM